ncbi:MAG: metallophosphoesterase [Longimicrobiaceae bacterium]
MTLVTPIRILHLSDFRFKTIHRWDSDPALSGVSDAVRELVDSGLRPDIVALTGDIADSGMPEEYSLASTWIHGSLLPALGDLPSRNLFIVPGNHDVNRAEIDDDLRLKQKELIKQRSQQEVEAALTGKQRSLFLARHNHFLEFLNRFPPDGGSEAAPWWSATRQVGWGRIGILGLNTAWLSSDDEDHGKLVVGRYQVQSLLEKVRGPGLVVALMHHPLSHLHEFDSSEIAPLLHRNCRLILSGHLHRHKGARVEDETGKTYLELAAGAVYGGSKRPKAFQLIEIYPDLRVRVHYRVWHREEWVPDSTAVRPSGVKTFSLGSGRRLWDEKRTNLVPTPPNDTFLGRKDQIEELRRLLVEQRARLVTILGAGGTGKTRLGREAGLQLVDKFQGGVWFADLTEARTGPDVVKAVGAALDLDIAGEAPPERTLAAILNNHERLLLILDNFEQVVERARPILDLWLARTTHVQFLVTSRIPIGLREQIVELDPLDAPPRHEIASMNINQILEFDAVRMFVDRAKDKNVQFSLEKDFRSVAKICAQLEGFPLAIEIAAARVQMMTVKEIVGKLQSKMLDILGYAPGSNSRHRTMEAAVRWSFDLLAFREQRVFLQLGVFRGGFSFDAAEEIVELPGGGGERDNFTSILHTLIGHKLLLVDDTGLDESHYSMSGVIREFCEKQWMAVADEATRLALEDRHARYFLKSVETWDREVRGPRAADALERVQLATENVIIAFDRKMKAGDPEIAGRTILALTRAQTVRNKGLFRLQRLEMALDALGSSNPQLRARLLVQISEAYSFRAHPEKAMAAVDQAVAITEELGEQGPHAVVLRRKAIMCMRAGDLVAAHELADSSADLAAKQGDDYQWCAAMELRGKIAYQQGMSDDALAACDAAVPVANRLGGVRLMARLQAVRASAYMTRDDYGTALEYFDRALELMRSLSADALEMEIGRAVALARLREDGEAIERYVALERQAIRRGNKAQTADAQVNHADLRMFRNEFAEAFELTRSANILFRDLKDQRGLAITLCNMAKILLELGQLEEARSRAHEALEILDRSRKFDRKYDFIVLCHLVGIELASGDSAAARAAAGRALEIASELGLSGRDLEVGECLAVLSSFEERHAGGE